jgi:zinc transport system substrate-binding protein
MFRVLLSVLLVLLPALGTAEPLRVFVSVLPQQGFVERIGGEHVRVQAMVQPGHSPATYDPSPRQIAALAEAELYVRTGVPFERAWMKRIRAANPDMRVLDLREGIETRRLEAHTHDHDHDPGHEHAGHGGEQDPHIWTSPLLVRAMSEAIRDALSELDPAHAADYARNQAAFAAELEALDREIRAMLADAPVRRFMVFHPAWGYFADAYGLTQIPIENEGKRPGPRSLNALIEQARREGIRVVLVQPQFDRRAAEQVADAIGGRVIAIDPLDSNYFDTLRRMARLIAGIEAG